MRYLKLFVLPYTFFSIILFLLCQIEYVKSLGLHAHYHTIIYFYYIQSLLIGLLLFFGLDSKSSPIFFLAGMVLRLVTAILFIVASSFILIDNMVQYIINFTLFYLIYLVFELTTLLSNLRSKIDT